MTELFERYTWIGIVFPVAPLAVNLWLRVYRGRTVATSVWLVSAAFAVSFLANFAGWLWEGQRGNNWWITFVYAPVQTVLFAFVVFPRWGRKIAFGIVGAIILFHTVGRFLGAVDYLTPSSANQIIGWSVLSLVVMASSYFPTSDLRNAVMVYCLGGTIAMVTMDASIEHDLTLFWTAWASFQLVQWVAVGMTIRVSIKVALANRSVKRSREEADALGVWHWCSNCTTIHEGDETECPTYLEVIGADIMQVLDDLQGKSPNAGKIKQPVSGYTVEKGSPRYFRRLPGTKVIKK